MSLTPGSRLGSYEVLGAIGAGGMGEVYRARDLKLNRDVALKILPSAFVTDIERLARFRREAQVLASLNHANIAAIYGFEDSGATHALVMELVDGEDLSQRISRGAIPLADALPIARQIAGALEAAHEQGIVHRDLKPANIRVRADGAVKVLDFGLAKAVEPADGGSNTMVNSPTMTSPAMTAMGMILGTAAYMSPEQARGKAVDKRTDVWAFGVVLYEMLTGRRAFEAEDVSLTLSKVLERDPDFAAFPDGVPALVRQVVRLCLIKPVKERIPDIATVRLALSGAFDVSVPDASTAVPSAAAPGRGRARLIAAVVLTAVVVGAVAFGVPRLMQQPFVQEPAGRFSVAPPTDQAVAANAPMPLGVSPDGRSLAIVARRLGEGTNVWIRDLDALEWREVPETNGATSIFWSPDSRFLGFFAAGQMKKVAAAGGTPIVVCRCPGGRGATWSRDDVIAFASAESPNVIEQVRASGGVPASVTTLAAGEIAHEFPVFLPDGRHFLYTTGGPSKVYVGSLDGAARTLALDQPNVSNVQFARGNLLWVREGALVTQPFDTGRMAVTGDPQPVANVRTDSPELSVSDTGVLVYVPVAKVTAAPLTWLDRGGKRIKQETVDGAISAPNLSRDGSQVAIERRDSAGSDIWVLDLRRGTNTRLTFDGQSIRPIFSGDGTRVVFGKDNTESMFLRRSSATGTEETLVPGEPTDWSPDNEHILFIRNGDLWVLSLSDRKTSAIVTGPGNDRRGRFSPDGKWIAYESDESGRFEIYVQRFPTTAERWTVSANGGGSAWWRSDGRELFFVTPDSKMMAVDVTLGRTFEQGVPRVLFGVPGRIANGRFVVSLDGQQFLMPLLADSAPPPLTVLMNWTPPGTAPVKK